MKSNMIQIDNITEIRKALERADTRLFLLSSMIENLLIRNINEFNLTDLKRIESNRKEIDAAINLLN